LAEIFKVTNFEVVYICGEKNIPCTFKGMIRYMVRIIFRLLWRIFIIAEMGGYAKNISLSSKLIAVSKKRCINRK